MLDVLDLFINLTNLEPMISPEPKKAPDLIWLIIGSAVMMAVSFTPFIWKRRKAFLPICCITILNLKWRLNSDF
jgi:hypothetical protein